MFAYEKIKSEYDVLSRTATIKYTYIEDKAKKVAESLLKHKSMYTEVSAKTGVPALWLMVINERESSGSFDAYLGNGDPLAYPTVHVPKGRGPFSSWESGAVDAIDFDHINRACPDGAWSWSWFLYLCETWNGWGYRLHGKRSAYLWAGSTVYLGGKYVEDGEFEPDAWDTQLGVFVLALALIKIDPSLAFSPAPVFDPNQSIEIPTPTPRLAQLTGCRWVQSSLNKIMGTGLRIDGSYGRLTRAAVREFQQTHGLDPDGIIGPLTCAAIDQSLAALAKSQTPPDSAEKPEPKTTHKGATMDFGNIVSLANLVVPQFGAALSAANPLLPVAVNAVGAALGLDAPHSPESVSAGASEKPADAVAAALKKAADAYLTHVTTAAAPLAAPAAPSPVATVVPAAGSVAPVHRTGGEFISQIVSGGLHAITAIGGILVGSGLLDPTAGPLAGLVKSNPLIGLALVVAGAALNWKTVQASNAATAQALGSKF